MRPWAPGLVHGRGGNPTGGGSGYAERPRSFVALTWHFRMPARCLISLVTGFGLALGVLGTERVGNPLVDGISRPVDAVA